MKKSRLRTALIFSVAILSGATLLHVSQEVQDAEEKLALIKSSIQREREDIRILTAEWEYLNNPARLEDLAARYLDLLPPDPQHLTLKPSDLIESVVLSSEANLLHNVSVKPSRKPVGGMVRR